MYDHGFHCAWQIEDVINDKLHDQTMLFQSKIDADFLIKAILVAYQLVW